MGSHLLLAPSLPAQMTREDPVLDAFRREVAYIFNTLQRLGARPSEVEDLSQEVFIALRRSWDNYDPARPLRPYLFGLVFRVFSGYRRKFKREVAFATVELRDTALNADELLQSKQTRAVLLSALEKIPLPRRAVLVMHELDDVPMRQVATALSIPLFTAYSRLRKARKELEATVRRLQQELGGS
jgi:RNA polymerase sigma-70 factor (ECF subfamily)